MGPFCKFVAICYDIAMASDVLIQQLRKHNYSVTKPRQAVFSYLLSHGPTSLGDLCRHLKTIDRASIYRTISLFEELGFVRRVSVGWKYKIELTDLFTVHHHHLHCQNCGKVIDIHDKPAFDLAVAELAQEHGFRPLSHELEIRGICQNCLASSVQ